MYRTRRPVVETITHGDDLIDLVAAYLHVATVGIYLPGFRGVEHTVLSGHLEALHVAFGRETVKTICEMKHSLVAVDLHRLKFRRIAAYATHAIVAYGGKISETLADFLLF